jgi:hypothetical protein
LLEYVEGPFPHFKPSYEYSMLPFTASKQLGTYIGMTSQCSLLFTNDYIGFLLPALQSKAVINTTNVQITGSTISQHRRCFRLENLRALLLPFVTSLQHLQPRSNEESFKEYIPRSIDSLLEGVGQSLPARLSPDDLGEMQAILHRVITVLISLSLVRNSGELHTAVLHAWHKASFTTCKRSMRELLWGYSNEFIAIEYDLVYDLRDKPAVSLFFYFLFLEF